MKIERLVSLTPELDKRVREVVEELKEHDASLSFSSVTRDLWRDFLAMVKKSGNPVAARQRLITRRH
jgi:hypothetical protein